jgi:hypothetical protein
MPQQCACETELLKHIPVRSLVWLIVSFYHQDDAAIIAELTREDPDQVPYLWHPGCMNTTLLTGFEKKEHVSRWPVGLMESRWPGSKSSSNQIEYADRWIFEVGPSGMFIHFLGESHGTPQDEPCSRCILTVVNGAIIVEIDNVLLGVDSRGDFGSYHGTPFARNWRAGLRSKMYSLAYLEPDDPQHGLFDRMCDLAHATIWSWIH